MPQNGMYAPPRAATEYQGWRIHRVFCDVCDEELQARRPSKTGRRTHATKRHVCATRTATDNRGWRIHRVFCDVCDEGLQARGHSIAEAAHMPQNGMYAPPLGCYR